MLLDQTLILDRAIRIYGEDAQIEQSIEELSELILALQKHKRHATEPTRIGVIDEIADVTLMIKQLDKIFGHDEVVIRKGYKLKRLNDRLNQEENLRERTNRCLTYEEVEEKLEIERDIPIEYNTKL